MREHCNAEALQSNIEKFVALFESHSGIEMIL
jgi:hypothetical protein